MWLECPHTLLPPRLGAKRALKRGAGFFLPGVWGCPPTLTLPQDWEIKVIEKTLVKPPSSELV
jgi:hypothetical protein